MLSHEGFGLTQISRISQIHTSLRSYVAVRMANASEMMRFRVICEIRVRQKSCVKREYFYNAYSLILWLHYTLPSRG